MTLSETAIRQRKKTLNASEVAIIFGLSPFSKTVTELWQEKVYATKRQKSKSHQRAGHYVEDMLVKYTCDREGIRVRRNQARRKRGTIWRCTHDAVVVGMPRGLEGKAASKWMLAGLIDADNRWGADGSDLVPDFVMVQVQTQMYVSDFEAVYVPFFDGSILGFRLLLVWRNEPLIEEIVLRGEKWWNDYVVTRTPPPRDKFPRLETLQRVIPTEKKVVQVEEWMVADWIRMDRAAKLVDASAKAAKARVAESMGDAEIGLFGDDEQVLHYPREANDTRRVLRLTSAGRFPWISEQEVERVYA